MSESSEEKTKRKYVWDFLAYPWVHQTSIFFEPENTKALLPEMARVKPLMRKAYPNQPFLLRVAKYNQGRGRNIGWVTIFTLEMLDDLQERLEDWIREDVNVRNRAISVEMRLDAAATILRERPHDLHKLFEKKRNEKINRYALLNRASLPTPDESLYEQLKAQLDEE